MFAARRPRTRVMSLPGGVGGGGRGLVAPRRSGLRPKSGRRAVEGRAVAVLEATVWLLLDDAGNPLAARAVRQQDEVEQDVAGVELGMGEAHRVAARAGSSATWRPPPVELGLILERTTLFSPPLGGCHETLCQHVTLLSPPL
ncbi:hypothetical protein GGTG_02331 [Gaeumannomyces tritici R3-111a-1]|uniref:Uncharacterized protein n=1 Tax=Gaeumannomyces tritici (strain R3-111a-1) TaxID=644352 RepID=J3NM27_GAET3|nr:hypothetical protein GGTG_02331 [Gaeumannomyces tritici R3-111a-1]EJT82358.1 hypothetical protein GGTG_02331 [Gaeumannomyces tritici R3-111a-1]